jgi:TolB-like protein/tetratricopeptide (TPR) repeat protein
VNARPPAWQTFLADLKRRRVFRVMTFYGVAGFVVLQAADLLVPVLLLPDWTYRLVGLLLLAGFPIAIGLAWIFDFGADGVRRTEPVQTEELVAIATAPRRQRWPAGLLALAATALLVGGVWFALRGDRTERAASVARAGDTDAAPSLAVLPFANLARTADTEPFVDGVHDDLLTQLSKIGSLRVISRTSVQGYRETTKNVREIADELGVGYVLEGGVQRAGDQLRINVQLIDARSDGHVWAETYNRTLSVANVFAIQSEIATAIAGALRTRLSPEVRRSIEARPTESLAAYDHYQRGLAYFRRTLIARDVVQAVREFESALSLDTAFAAAWARLAIARLTLSWEFGHTHEVARARYAIERAEALAPGESLTHVARGYYHYYGRREYDAALDAFARAEAISPGDPEALLPAGWTLRRPGRFEEALARFEAAHARDPRNWDNVLASLAQTKVVLRRFDEARQHAELGIAIAPDLAAGYSTLALIELMAAGDTAAAAVVIERGGAQTELLRILFDFPAVSRILSGRYEAHARAATSAVANRSGDLVNTTWFAQDLPLPAYFLQKGRLLRALGDDAAARAHFDSARVVLEPLVRQQPADVIWTAQGSLHSGLGVALAALGRREEAIRYGREGLDAVLRVGDAITAPMRRAELAEIYVVTGEHQLALDELERLLAEPGWTSPALLRVDPVWAPLRAEPRFQRLASTRSQP